MENKNNDIKLEYLGKKNLLQILQMNPAIITPVQKTNHNQSLYYGDNLSILLALMNQGDVKVDLIYLDPPYSTKRIFTTKDQKLAFDDFLEGAEYIEFMRERLVVMYELLADTGSIYVHVDSKMLFHLKIVMDEVFGVKNFRNLISRKKCNSKSYTKKSFGDVTDYILFYTKTDKYTWNRPTISSLDNIKTYSCVDDSGRKFKKAPLHAPGIRNGRTGTIWRGMLPPEGKHWLYSPDKMDEMDSNGDIYWSKNGNPRKKIYLDSHEGSLVQDIWMDCVDSINQNTNATGYPAEKNQKLLDRIISASSNVGDLILDCFAGSGTALFSASDLGRNWIGIDNSLEAIKTILSRAKTTLMSEEINIFQDFSTPLPTTFLDDLPRF